MSQPSTSPAENAKRLAHGVRLVRDGCTLRVASKRAHCATNNLGRHLRALGIVTKTMKKNGQDELAPGRDGAKATEKGTKL